MVRNIRLLSILHLLYYSMKRVFIYFFFFFLLFSCKKDIKDNDFRISLQQTIPTSLVEFQENIFVKINYEHPEGYIGFFDPDFLSLEVKDSRLENADYYH